MEKFYTVLNAVQRNYKHCDVCGECVHPSLVHDIFTNKCISSRDL